MPVGSLLNGLAIAIATLLAAFFAFVGYHKAFAPLAVLEQDRVWSLGLPEWAGRLVGWSELLLAAILLGLAVPRLRIWAAVAAAVLIANQLAAAAVHWSRGEADALPQNVVLVALLVLVGLAAHNGQTRMGERQ